MSTLPLPSTMVAMLLADARLPTGSHTHSAGLEPALLGGLCVAEVPEFLLGRARTTALVDAGTAVVARHCLVAGSGGGLHGVERAWAARTPSRAVRESARLLGRGYLRLGLRLWPESSALRELANADVALPRPLVLGAMAAVAGMEALDLARLVIYDEVAAGASALLKLEPRDPADIASWTLRICAEVDPLLADVACITSPDSIPASGAPQAEGWAEAHALLSQRLFRA